jgi:hypothetical protein
MAFFEAMSIHCSQKQERVRKEQTSGNAHRDRQELAGRAGGTGRQSAHGKRDHFCLNSTAVGGASQIQRVCPGPVNRFVIFRTHFHFPGDWRKQECLKSAERCMEVALEREPDQLNM